MISIFNRKKRFQLYDRNFWFALSLLVGTIVGVGLFGLPYVTLKSSFWVVVFYFVVISVGVVLLNHFYVEIGIHAKETHHLPGYAEKFLGRWAKYTAGASEAVGLFGAQLAYLIVGGGFLARFFGFGEGNFVIFFVLVFFTAGAVLVWRGFRSVVHTELVMLIVLIVLVVAFFMFGIVNGMHRPSTLGTFENLWAPYGIIIFSLWGLSVLPDILELFPGEEKKISRVLFWGVVVSALVYLVFIWAVLSISGENTSKESLSALEPLLPPALFKFGLLFGIITTFTSFLGIGLALKKMFMQDYRLAHGTSWLVAMGAPIILYALGFKNFLKVIGVSGSLGLAVSGIVVYFIYLRIKKEVEKKPSGKRVIRHKFFTHESVIIVLALLAALGVLASVFFEIKN